MHLKDSNRLKVQDKDTFAGHRTWYRQLAVSDMDHTLVLLVYMEIHVQHTTMTTQIHHSGISQVEVSNNQTIIWMW